MDSLEAKQQISILTAHLGELWELICIMPDPIQRGIVMSHVMEVNDKITILQRITMD